MLSTNFSANCENHFLEKWFNKGPKSKEKSTPILLILLKKAYKFNKKNLVKIWSCFFILFVILNILYIQPIEWSKFKLIFNEVNTKNKSFTAVFIFGILFFAINDIFLNKLSYSGRIFQKDKKISFIEWLKLHSISFLIRSVTPFSIGSEPYIIWWLKKRGIPLRRGASIVSALTISWFLSQGIITWPSFIYLNLQGNWTKNQPDLKYYWMMVSGLLIDFISTAFVFSISYSKRVHYFFSITKYKFNALFRIPNTLTIFDIKWKYLSNKKFKKNFIRTFFNIVTFRAIFVFTIQNILNYSLFALFSSSINNNWSNFFNNFHIINISTTSNNFVPTPGSEGSIQFTIDKMNKLFSLNGGSQVENGKTSENSNKLNETIFLWRWSQKYQPLLLSSLFLFIYYLNFWIKKRINKFHLKKSICPELTSWYTVTYSLTPKN
ncbi:lysylphosphatidylglycerol synthase domain-containing protein [Mycoplasma parvum]|uniref:Uncharacterized protein n=1 Tax=Mycoplasma parvum str. Indiana TaxID=1403316 RepID=U5NC52_9MOLU|nr:lysylphosphatidylglycerol synthase domain-containing protein [Mycoplasma parvum]AGX88865.1 hypothetical protein PRV_00480 [Mycoplasma parvum str. Indiana]